MVALGTAALAALLTVAIFLGPGVIVARLTWSDEPTGHDDVAPLVLALAWGAGAVPTLAFFLHLATGLFVSLGTVAGVALAHYVGAAIVGVRRRARGEDAGIDWWIEPLRGVTPTAWMTLVGVWVLWLLRYDPAPLPPEASCIYGAALVATGDREEGASLLFENLEDARLGNSGVIAGFVAVYGGLGFRLLFAACGVLMAVGGRALGELAGPERPWSGLVGSLVLALNPWVFSLPQADENMLTLGFGAAALALLLGRRPPWLVGGALLGLVLAMRHVLILSAPAAFLWAFQDPRRGRALARLSLGLLLATFFEHLHHYLALGSVFRFESNPQFPALPYSFLGVSFTWEGMVNWPLHDELVRTPWNPFPMWMLWPLHALKAWGLLLSGVLCVGLVAGAIREGKAALFWAAWVLPSAALLLLQESWDFPNKMGVALVLFAALPWALVHGLSATRLRGALVGGGLLIALSVLTVASLRDVVIPVDGRYHARFPYAPLESEQAVRGAKEAAMDLGLLPSWSLMVRHGPLFDRDHVAHFAQTLADRAIEEVGHPWSWGSTELPERGDHVLISIRPGGRGGNEPVFALAEGTAHLDLVNLASGSITGWEVPWDLRPMHAYGLRGDHATVVTLQPPYPGEAEPCVCSWADGEFTGPCEDRCNVVFDLAGVLARELPPHERGSVTPAPGTPDGPPWSVLPPFSGDELLVLVSEGAVSFGIVELPYANRVRLWRLVVSREGITVLDGPRWPWHG